MPATTFRFAQLCFIAALATAALRSAEAPATIAWPDGTPQQIREDVFGLRFRLIREIDGPKAGLAFLDKAFAQNPSPEAKAYMGWICLFSKGWGYPERLDESRGLTLVTEAMNEGSGVGCDVLARAMGAEIGGRSLPPVVARLLTTAADRGATRSMARLGLYYALGYGVPQNMTVANRLVRRAAELGQPLGLVEIGDAYADGRIGGKPDEARALSYYYEASCHADSDAWAKLKELATKGSTEANLYLALGYVREANRASWLPPSRVKELFKTLVELAGEHPQALVEIGVAQLNGEYAKRDYARAKDCFARAAAHGNDEAKFFLAKMKLRGWGQPAEREPAMADIATMADNGLAEAANYLGYLYYWGTRDVPGQKENPTKAFQYVRLAAERGHPAALMNLGFCYSHGIGTPVNYALAAKIYWQAYLRGYTRGRDEVKALLPFIK